MESTRLQREQSKGAAVVGDRQKSGANVIWRRPLTLNDHSPAQRLGRPFELSDPSVPFPLQAKLNLSTPGDQYEQEADRVAEQVMRMPDPTLRLQGKCGCGGSASSSAQSCEECAGNEFSVQRRPNFDADQDHASSRLVREVLRSPGQMLDEHTRSFFEERFRRDFNNVTIHTDERAAESARGVNARAYTVGRDIVFGRGEYAPETTTGKNLLAHELTHTIQQGARASRLQTPTIQRWTLPIRAEELGPGRTDRFGNRTFDCGDFSVFVPAGAISVPTNRVHVFFSPGGVSDATTAGSNAVAVHGLRGAADPSQWILIGVPGIEGGLHTIRNADVLRCLRVARRAQQIDSLRLSAHSRGAAGLAESLRRRLLTPALIDHVTLLDVWDHRVGLTRGLQSSRVSATRVTAYNVIWGDFPLDHMRNVQVPYSCIRSIGYARLIRDAVATGRISSALPPGIASRVSALTLPPRGSFSTATPTPPGKTSLRGFCSNPTNAAALTAMRDGEPPRPTSLLSPRLVTARAPTSPYAFIEENNVLGFNDPRTPRSQWYRFNPQVYSHHLFVAEIAHEMFQ